MVSSPLSSIRFDNTKYMLWVTSLQWESFCPCTQKSMTWSRGGKHGVLLCICVVKHYGEGTVSNTLLFSAAGICHLCDGVPVSSVPLQCVLFFSCTSVHRHKMLGLINFWCIHLTWLTSIAWHHVDKVSFILTSQWFQPPVVFQNVGDKMPSFLDSWTPV